MNLNEIKFDISIEDLDVVKEKLSRIQDLAEQMQEEINSIPKISLKLIAKD